MPKLPTRVSRIDPVSAVLSLVAVLAIVLTLQQGPRLGWPIWLFGGLALGMVGLVVFIWLQRRAQRHGQDALVPLKLFRIRNFRWGAISVSTLGFAVYSMNLPIMLYLQLGAGLSAQMAGLLILPQAIVSVVTAPILGRLTDRLPPGRISTCGFGAMMASMALFAILMSTEVPLGWLLIPLVLQGAANAMSWSANSAISMRGLPADLVGAGSGVYNTARQVGAVIGAAALGAVMQIGLQYTGFSQAMGLSLVLHVLVLGLGFLAVSRFRPERDDPAAGNW
ncbi:MFS transporter [Enteractinococcus coprophilus]|uniref:MFS transporter n=1 Tax=Enteractinococcus coprophilus TaxID=1027633 RepID=UPI001B85DCF4|nr:MFS transporter [Enteractinococcus coprophilus]